MSMRLFFSFIILTLPALLQAQGNPSSFTGIQGCFHKTISIQVHLLEDVNEEVNVVENDLNNLLTELNTYFEPICLGFEICGMDTIPNTRHDSIEVGITDIELATLFNVQNKVNLYLVQSIEGADHPCGYSALGDTIIPDQDSIRDALFLGKDCLEESRFLARIMGYYLGLDYTFGDGNELVDGSNCATAGDRICDTAADPQGAVNADCQLVGNPVDANGDHYIPDMCNLMSFYDVDCDYKLTNEQYNRILKILQTGRSYLW